MLRLYPAEWSTNELIALCGYFNEIYHNCTDTCSRICVMCGSRALCKYSHNLVKFIERELDKR